MAVLGKRKAAAPAASEEDANDVFRRYFESQFLPLPGSETTTKRARAAEEEERDDEDEEWGGLSDDGDEEEEDDDDDCDEEESQDEDDETIDSPTVVEVVDHSASQPPKPTAMSKRELKAFMSSRPPDQTTPSHQDDAAASSSAKSKKALPEDAPSLLAQDLELRRLLSESHLLAPAVTNSLSGGAAPEPKTFAAGRTRHKATDLRVQALGSSLSIHKQQKMPMNMRKGMVAAADARETKRRREAKENGVILEREAGKKKKTKSRRDLGVDRPGVGRLRGAQLSLSERDVKRIEGGRDAFGRRSKR